jgi:hypothetical protein
VGDYLDGALELINAVTYEQVRWGCKSERFRGKGEDVGQEAGAGGGGFGRDSEASVGEDERCEGSKEQVS